MILRAILIILFVNFIFFFNIDFADVDVVAAIVVDALEEQGDIGVAQGEPEFILVRTKHDRIVQNAT